jgi:hypothetical protein
VVDEAQVAAVYLNDSFHSFTTGTDMHPVLRAFYGFLWKTGIFQGVILAGTGLSMGRHGCLKLQNTQAHANTQCFR